MAEVSGFSTSFISDLENGKVTAELGKAIVLANLLGIDVEMNARL
ncbi:MAG: helix-turn-helix domain-containing protein [Lachnospiraceae bacterium]|nr:helix-turn-helix domain-containing protein [Lachnospiraceae bacterium]